MVAPRVVFILVLGVLASGWVASYGFAAVTATDPPPAAALAQATSTGTLGPNDVGFEGRVLLPDLRGGPPQEVSGAWVFLYSEPPGFCGPGATTGGDGRYAVVCRGLRVGAEVAASVRTTVGSAAGRDAARTWRVRKADRGTRIALDFSLSPSPATPPADELDGHSYGRVVASSPDGSAVPGARVATHGCWGGDRTVLADADGRFEVHCRLSAIGCLDVTADAPGYKPHRGRDCGSPISPRGDLGKNMVLVLEPVSTSPPLVLEPEADSWVEYPYPPGIGTPPREGPFGSDPALEIGWWDVGLNQDGLLRFARPDALFPESLARAELWLEVTGASSQSGEVGGSREGAQLSLHPVHDAWDEDTVTGGNRPAAGGVVFEAEVSVGLARLDVTAAARAWLAGDRADGWVMRGTHLDVGGFPIGATILLASRESPYGPRLVLYQAGDGYPTATVGPSTTPTPTPSPTLITPTATPSPTLTKTPQAFLPVTSSRHH